MKDPIKSRSALVCRLLASRQRLCITSPPYVQMGLIHAQSSTLSLASAAPFLRPACWLGALYRGKRRAHLCVEAFPQHNLTYGMTDVKLFVSSSD